MSITVAYYLTSAPCDRLYKTFTGWDNAECHRHIAAWERSLGDTLLEWRQTVYR